MPGPLGPQPPGRDRRLPEPAALALRHPQPLLAPQTLHPLAVHIPALLTQMVMRATVPPPRPIRRELPQLRTQRRVVLSPLRLVALGRAMLPDHPASPALADTETVANHRDRPTPTGWAHQFPPERSPSTPGSPVPGQRRSPSTADSPAPAPSGAWRHRPSSRRTDYATGDTSAR